MILQKQIQTSKATILVIGNLPGSAKILRSDIGVLTVELQNENLDTSDYAIPVGEWKPLGFLKDIEEDVAKELVESKETMPMGVLYKDYSTPGWQTSNSITAAESLHSLIESNCELKNKYGEAPKSKDFGSFTRFHEMFDVWQEEQSRVFTNPFLLKKI